MTLYRRLIAVCFTIVLCLPLTSTAQNIQDVDYYGSYIWDSFLDAGFADKIIERENPDYNLLNATVFFLINQFRERGSIDMLNHDVNLETVAKNYFTFYGAEDFSRPDKLRVFFGESLPYMAREQGFSGAYQDILPIQLDEVVQGEMTYYQLGKSILSYLKVIALPQLRDVSFSVLGGKTFINPNSGTTKTIVVLGGYRLNLVTEE